MPASALESLPWNCNFALLYHPKRGALLPQQVLYRPQLAEMKAGLVGCADGSRKIDRTQFPAGLYQSRGDNSCFLAPLLGRHLAEQVQPQQMRVKTGLGDGRASMWSLTSGTVTDEEHLSVPENILWRLGIGDDLDERAG